MSEPDREVDLAQATASFLRETLGESAPDVIRFHGDLATYDVRREGNVRMVSGQSMSATSIETWEEN